MCTRRIRSSVSDKLELPIIHVSVYDELVIEDFEVSGGSFLVEGSTEKV